MRNIWGFALVLLGCSSTPLDTGNAGDAGDAGDAATTCPPGPTQLTQGGEYGVAADPKTGACPASYCFECEVLDWAQGCPDLVCLKTAKYAYQGQCSSICDAGADAAASD